MSSILEVGVAFVSKLVCMSIYQLCQCIWKYSRGEYRIERGGAGYVDEMFFFRICVISILYFRTIFWAFLLYFIVHVLEITYIFIHIFIVLCQ